MEYIAFTGKRVVDKLRVCDKYGAQGFIVGFSFVLSRANGTPQRPIRAQKDIYCLDTAEFIDRVCSLRDMNKRESKVKVGINYGESFLKVCAPRQWSTTTMTLNCINPLRRALPLSFRVRKGCRFMHQRHINRQEIVYLAKINEILDYIFTGGLEMPNLMTGIISNASTHPYAYYISASKSWDPEAPLRVLNFYARQFDKGIKSWRHFLAAPSLTQRSQLCFFLLPLLLLYLKFKLVNL